MSRMLDALKQLDSKAGQVMDSAPPDQLEEQNASPETVAPADEAVTSNVEPDASPSDQSTTDDGDLDPQAVADRQIEITEATGLEDQTADSENSEIEPLKAEIVPNELPALTEQESKVLTEGITTESATPPVEIAAESDATAKTEEPVESDSDHSADAESLWDDSPAHPIAAAPASDQKAPEEPSIQLSDFGDEFQDHLQPLDAEQASSAPNPEAVPVEDPAPSLFVALESSSILTNPFDVAKDEPARLEKTGFESISARNLKNEKIGGQYQRLAEQMLKQLPQHISASVGMTGITPTSHVGETVFHLGMLVAELGEIEVLVIDADFASKTITTECGLSTNAGLSDVFTGEKPWHDTVVGLATDRLSILPAGASPIPTNPETFDCTAELIEELKQQFRLILICSGCCNTPASESLLRWCDASYVVLKLGQAEEAEVTAAVSRLRDTGTRLLGCVLTNVPA